MANKIRTSWQTHTDELANTYGRANRLTVVERLTCLYLLYQGHIIPKEQKPQEGADVVGRRKRLNGKNN